MLKCTWHTCPPLPTGAVPAFWPWHPSLWHSEQRSPPGSLRPGQMLYGLHFAIALITGGHSLLELGRRLGAPPPWFLNAPLFGNQVGCTVQCVGLKPSPWRPVGTGEGGQTVAPTRSTAGQASFLALNGQDAGASQKPGGWGVGSEVQSR